MSESFLFYKTEQDRSSATVTVSIPMYSLEPGTGTPVAIRSLGRNEVTNSFSETTWSRVQRLMYIALTVHQMQKIQYHSLT